MVLLATLLLVNALFITIINDVHAQNRSFTRIILDDMADFFGEGEFPSADFEKLQTCFAKWGDTELESRQNIAWSKFIQFYETSNSSNDFYWWDDEPKWYESLINVTGTFGNGGNRTYVIKGPCNYVSNIAYYRAAMRVCDYEDWEIPESYLKSLKQTFSTLAFASSCFHGGETQACQKFDEKLSSLSAYASYQIMARNLRTSNSRVIFGLREDIEPVSFMQLIQNFSDMATNNDIQLWKSETLATPFVADPTFHTIAIDAYFPELKIMVEENNFPLPLFVGIPLLIRTISTLSSFAFAFFWNEGSTNIPLLTGSTFNLTRLGAAGAGFLERFTSFLTGYETSEENLATRTNVYPGADYCNVVSPHALWHQESADGIVDLALLANDIDQLLKEHLQ